MNKQSGAKMKIVVNRCYGGFGLSHEAIMLYAEKKGLKVYPYQQKDGLRGDYFRYVPNPELKNRLLHPSYLTVDAGDKLTEKKFKSLYYDKNKKIYDNDIERNDPALVEVVEELKEKANGGFASLEVVDIPDDVEWEISEYDGHETVEEKHRSW
jgi:hypothetical protein